MDANRFIDILYKKPNRNPKKIRIENTLEEMQKLVDGKIEVVEFQNSLLICNRDGKIYGLEPNVVINGDTICGSFFIAGNDIKNADFISLTPKQYRYFSKLFNKQNELTNDKECEELE